MDLSKMSIKKIRELIVFTALLVVALWKFDVVLGILYFRLCLVEQSHFLPMYQ